MDGADVVGEGDGMDVGGADGGVNTIGDTVVGLDVVDTDVGDAEGLAEGLAVVGASVMAVILIVVGLLLLSAGRHALPFSEIRTVA